MVPLSVLTLSTATPAFAQTTPAQGQQTEQLKLTDDPKAKADMDTLMKKYNISDIKHIWKLDLDISVDMRNDLIEYLDNNTYGNYQ